MLVDLFLITTAFSILLFLFIKTNCHATITDILPDEKFTCFCTNKKKNILTSPSVTSHTMSHTPVREQLLTYGYIRQNYNEKIYNDDDKYDYPFVLKTIIHGYTKKIINSNILSKKMDLKLLPVLAETLKLVDTDIIKLFSHSSSKIMTNFINTPNTLTLFQTKKNEIFGLYISDSWKTASKDNFDRYGKLYYIHKSRNYIRIRSTMYLNKKLKKSIPVPLRNLIHYHQMKEIEVFQLVNYDPSIVNHYTPMNCTPSSETEYESYSESSEPDYYL